MFRQQLFVPSLDGHSRAEALAEAAEAFRTESSAEVDASRVDANSVRGTGLVRAMAGDATIDGQTAYAPFTGRWFGGADRGNAEQHCGEVIDVVPPLEVRVSKGAPAVWLRTYQYVWIGDGYEVRLAISLEPQSPQRVLLGYVVRVEEGQLARERKRQPRVGLADGAGRLIWISPDGVSFEETKEGPGGTETYTVTGFRYHLAGSACNRDERFQSLYTRAARPGTPAYALGK